jgi:hypothetical protein
VVPLLLRWGDLDVGMVKGLMRVSDSSREDAPLYTAVVSKISFLLSFFVTNWPLTKSGKSGEQASAVPGPGTLADDRQLL